MLVGLTTFKDGFVGIWNSIRQAVAQILSGMLQDFLQGYLRKMIAGFAGQAVAGGAAGSLLGIGAGAATSAGVTAATTGGTAAAAGGAGAAAAGAGAAGAGGRGRRGRGRRRARGGRRGAREQPDHLGRRGRAHPRLGHQEERLVPGRRDRDHDQPQARSVPAAIRPRRHRARVGLWAARGAAHRVVGAARRRADVQGAHRREEIHRAASGRGVDHRRVRSNTDGAGSNRSGSAGSCRRA